MVERFIDKQVRVLSFISNPENAEITNYAVQMAIDDLDLVINYLAASKLIQIEQKSFVPVFVDGEETNIESDEICINYKILDAQKIELTLRQTLEKSPLKRNRPLIKHKALELIARKIGDLESGTGLVSFLKNNGVASELVIYPNTKWKMVYDVLEYLAFSGKKEDHDLIFTLLEEISHPLALGGDRSRALEIQDFFSTCLQYDGYCMEKGKVVEVTDEIIDKIDKRIQERKAEGFSGLINDSAFSNFFSSNLFETKFQNQTKNSQIKQHVNIVEKQAPPVHVNIYNNNVQTNTMPQQDIRDTSIVETSLKDLKVDFDDTKAELNIGGKLVSIPPFLNEHFFCRSMFKRQKNEPVDWSIVYQEMQQVNEPSNTPKDKRKVQDSMYALNKRIKQVLNTEDEMFIWRELTITRQY